MHTYKCNQFCYVSTGSALSKCSFNGQQCCDDILIKFVDQGFRFLVQNDAFNFTSGLAGAQAAIDQMRNKTNGMVDDFVSRIPYNNILFCLCE